MLAAILFCQPDPTRLEAALDGLVAWAGILGAGTAAGTGLPAASAAFTSRISREERADVINRGLGVGFLLGMIGGMFTFVLYAANLVT